MTEGKTPLSANLRDYGDADTATDPFHRQDRISTRSAFASSADRQFRKLRRRDCLASR
jgi:hypothetical protein